VRQALRGLAKLDRLANPTAAADAALQRFGLEDHASVPAARLSRGLLQRLGLAQALLSPHPLLVLDEPAQGLDPVWRIRLRDEIRAAREAGATILLASHDLAEVERIADVAIVLEAGRVVEQVALDDESPVSSWLLGVSGPTAPVSETFARAREVAPGDWEVQAADAADLSARLAALLAAGVIVHRVEPVRDALETRMRRRAEDAQ
jgi:ABC-2 type transport system ATP-binding protein